MLKAAGGMLVLSGVIACGGGAPAPAVSPAPASSPSATPSAPSLRELLDHDMAPHHGVPWSTRSLVWSDFRGDPPEWGLEAAKTAYAIYYGWKCRGRAFEFRAVAAFHPRESWVKPSVLGDSAESRRVLAHEQTHFNIAEVYTRRLERHFHGLAGACALSDDALSADAQRFLEDEKAEQRRYDDETEHGLRQGPQAAWQARISRELAP